jgi:hypothetical protein
MISQRIFDQSQVFCMHIKNWSLVIGPKVSSICYRTVRGLGVYFRRIGPSIKSMVFGLASISLSSNFVNKKEYLRVTG